MHFAKMKNIHDFIPLISMEKKLKKIYIHFIYIYYYIYYYKNFLYFIYIKLLI